MNYIARLNQEEIVALCQIISGKEFKILFQNFSKEFAQIRPGFRPFSIPDKEAISLAVKNINKPFIFEFINMKVENWMNEINEKYEKLIGLKIDDAQALAEALMNSVFCEDIDLYFRLLDKVVSDLQYNRIIVYIKGAKEEKTLEEKNLEHNSVNDTSSLLHEDIDKLEKQLADSKKELVDTVTLYESKIHTLSEEKRAVENSFADTQQKLQRVQQEKQEMEMELSLLQARANFNDSEIALEANIDTDFQFVSLCEVAPVDFNGKKSLVRLADIGQDSKFEAFNVDEDAPKIFENRYKLYYKDGPSEVGTIGVWKWSPVPNLVDSSRDYIVSEFNPSINPIEIIVLETCKSADELLEQLKKGVDTELITSRTLFAIYLTKGQYTGFLCKGQYFEKFGSKIQLSKTVISLPRYDFGGKDIVRVSNGKVFLRTIGIGIPSEVVNVKDPFDIVRTIILSRNSWQTFKQKGKTKNEWKSIRDFLEELDTIPVIDEIKSTIHCSYSEAQKIMEDFKEYAGAYIDGTSIEDNVLSAIINVNPDLMDRCKSLIMNEWISENQTAINEANTILDNIRHQIEEEEKRVDKELSERRGLFEQEKSVALGELASIKQEHDKLSASLLDLTEEIETKEKLAVDVQTAVEKRIRNAQAEAADFIASLAFVPQTQYAPPAAVVERAQDDENTSYCNGIEVYADNIEENSSWNDALNTISDELIEAGVMQKYAYQLGAYMYSSYLNHNSLLIVGPNASPIVDAFSVALFGRTAGSLVCADKYSAESVQCCLSSEDSIIKITNPFCSNWMARIPEILCDTKHHFMIVHPYAEDIQVEPRSVFNYMLPIFTEFLVDRPSTGRFWGGKCTDAYKDFQLIKPDKSYERLMIKMRIPLILRNKIQIVLSNMHAMISDKDTDFDVLFALLPYAMSTMQTSIIMDSIQNKGSQEVSISGELKGYLCSLYGDQV